MPPDIITKTICKRCLYDESTPSIEFDSDGICNYCKLHDRLESEYSCQTDGTARLREICDRIKKEGRSGKYDVIVGVSGGCDSSYLIYLTKELGLRPLAVHFDNTWDSNIATENMHKVLTKLKVALFTYVVDNKEYDDIYRSFLKAGVPDIEAPTDIGLAATLYIAAEKHSVKYFFQGHNFRTEGVSPLGWLYMDGKYIASVQRQFGNLRLNTFPNLSLASFLRWIVLKRIKGIRPLYYVKYEKEKVKKFLTEEFGWQWYGGHHLENQFTAFYHSYFLPRRFCIDQRINGYSALVRSGQMTREEGLRLINEPPYLNPKIVELVKKRLGFSDAEFEKIMNLPKKTYRDFKTYKRTFELLRPFFWLMYKMDRVPKSFYVKYTSKDF
jgi:N-acetyl sugar amidotransferase